jgi:hypothetical protein
MKKYVLGGIALLGVMTVAAWNVSLGIKSNSLSTLSLANTEEASANELTDWWNRPDYDCISVTCITLFGGYKSNVSKYVGAGNGSVAHTWICTGCGDYGWKVD